MLRFYLLLFGLVCCAGCAANGQKGPFDEALKDLREQYANAQQL